MLTRNTDVEEKKRLERTSTAKRATPIDLTNPVTGNSGQISSRWILNYELLLTGSVRAPRSLCTNINKRYRRAFIVLAR